MGRAILRQHPAIVLRSRYQLLRALAAVAMLAIAVLAVAVVLLAIGSDELGGADVQIRPWAPRYAGN